MIFCVILYAELFACLELLFHSWTLWCLIFHFFVSWLYFRIQSLCIKRNLIDSNLFGHLEAWKRSFWLQILMLFLMIQLLKHLTEDQTLNSPSELQSQIRALSCLFSFFFFLFPLFFSLFFPVQHNPLQEKYFWEVRSI